MWHDVPPETREVIRDALPSALGSGTALFWLRESWPRRICYFVAGFGFARYATPLAVTQTGIDAGLAGWILGTFGMLLVSKCFEMLTAVDTKDLWNRVLTRLGLPPRREE